MQLNSNIAEWHTQDFIPLAFLMSHLFWILDLGNYDVTKNSLPVFTSCFS